MFACLRRKSVLLAALRPVRHWDLYRRDASPSNDAVTFPVAAPLGASAIRNPSRSQRLAN